MRPPGYCTAQDPSAQHMRTIRGRAVAMRLTVLCELPAEHALAHRSTFPDGTVWTWGGCSAIVRNEPCALLAGHEWSHTTSSVLVADTQQLIQAAGVDADGLTEIEASAKCQCGHRRDDHHRSWASCMEHVDAGRKWCACEEYRPAAVLTFIEPPEITP